MSCLRRGGYGGGNTRQRKDAIAQRRAKDLHRARELITAFGARRVVELSVKMYELTHSQTQLKARYKNVHLTALLDILGGVASVRVTSDYVALIERAVKELTPKE
jgi:hypothetical protein